MNFIELGNFSIGGLLGLLIGGFLGHALALRRSKHDRKIKVYNETVLPMRNSLIEGISRIDKGEVEFEVIKDLFQKQKKFILAFRGTLSKNDINDFLQIWQQYENYYNDVCNRSTAEILYPPEGNGEFLKKRRKNIKQEFFLKLLDALPLKA